MKNAQLHIRLDSDLLEQVRQYAGQHDKTITQIVTEHFRYLLSVETVRNGIVSAMQSTEKMCHGARARNGGGRHPAKHRD